MDRETDRQGTGNRPRGNGTQASYDFQQTQEARLRELEEEVRRIRRAMSEYPKRSRIQRSRQTMVEPSEHMSRHVPLQQGRSRQERRPYMQMDTRGKKMFRPKNWKTYKGKIDYITVKAIRSRGDVPGAININLRIAGNDVPICYNCQKPGHIARTCPLRKAAPPRPFGQVKHVACGSQQQERQHRPSVYRGRPSYRQQNPVRGHQAAQERVSPVAPEADTMMPATIASSEADRHASSVRPPDMEE